MAYIALAVALIYVIGGLQEYYESRTSHIIYAATNLRTYLNIICALNQHYWHNYIFKIMRF